MVDPHPYLADLHLVDLPGSLPEAARLIEALYLRLAGWIEAHLRQTATVITASGLSLYGRHVTEALRRIAYGWPFPLRAGLFIGVVGLGFGLVVATVSPLLFAGLKLVATPYLVPATLSAFIVIGILAERSGRI